MINMDDRKPIRILLAEDHSIVRQGIRRILEKTSGFIVVGEAEDGEQALTLAKDLQPDVLICDIRLPILGGIEVIRHLSEFSPHTKSLVLSAFDDDEYVFETMAAGASGYLLKTMDAKIIPEAVKRAYCGELVLYPPVAGIFARLLGSASPSANKEPLTAREREIVTLAAQGLKNKAIAKELNTSVRTVEGHFSRIFSKLSVSSRLEAINICLDKHLIDKKKDESH